MHWQSADLRSCRKRAREMRPSTFANRIRCLTDEKPSRPFCRRRRNRRARECRCLRRTVFSGFISVNIIQRVDGRRDYPRGIFVDRHYVVQNNALQRNVHLGHHSAASAVNKSFVSRVADDGIVRDAAAQTSVRIINCINCKNDKISVSGNAAFDFFGNRSGQIIFRFIRNRIFQSRFGRDSD